MDLNKVMRNNINLCNNNSNNLKFNINNNNHNLQMLKKLYGSEIQKHGWMKII